MKQYLLSIYQPDGDPPPPEVLEPILRNLEALNREIQAAGAWVFAAGLHPASTATVLKAKDGDVLMTDGPFTEGKEHLGRRSRRGAGLGPAPGRDPVSAVGRGTPHTELNRGLDDVGDNR